MNSTAIRIIRRKSHKVGFLLGDNLYSRLSQNELKILPWKKGTKVRARHINIIKTLLWSPYSVHIGIRNMHIHIRLCNYGLEFKPKTFFSFRYYFRQLKKTYWVCLKSLSSFWFDILFKQPSKQSVKINTDGGTS